MKQMEKPEIEKEKPTRLDKILEDVAQKAAEITISRDSSLGKLWEKKDSESREKFREKTKELWKEFAVHGVMKFDEAEKKVKLLPFTDLDGKVSIGLLRMAGFDTKNVKYVPPGEFVPGAINLDTGGKTGIVVSKKDKTAWIDHHGEEAGPDTIPAERMVYLALVSMGFLKKNETLDKLTQFVSRIDRALYPDQEKLFWKSDKTVLGLQRFVNFTSLYKYFRDGRSPEEELNINDLKKYGLIKGSNEQKKLIEEARIAMGRLKRNGCVIDTKFGKVVVDVGRKLPGGYQVVRASGFDGYLMFNPETESFFLSINNADLSNLQLHQGTSIRKTMWIKSPGGEKLDISLGEIIKKLGGKIPKKSKLNKSMEKPKVEQSKIETKKEKSQHEVELEQRPMPQEGEAYSDWLKRIGGSNVEIASNLEEYSPPRKKIDRPLIIDSKGDIILNDKNILEIYGEKNKKQIEEWIEQKVPHIEKEKGIYRLEKELFSQNPGIYFQSIGNVFKAGHKVVADFRFEASVGKWIEKLKKEKPKEKTPTLDKEIEQKKKEIEEIERGYNIYYSPVVRDLKGLYYKKKYEGIEGLKKELKELERKKGKPEETLKEAPKPKEISEPEGLPEEVLEEPTTKEQFKDIKKDLRKVTKRISEGGVLGRADLEKKQYKLEKLKKKVEERLKIEKLLKEISKKIEQGGVFGRSKLEKEQKKLEKRLKKLK